MSEASKEKLKIPVVEDADATGQVADVYAEWRQKSGRQAVLPK